MSAQTSTSNPVNGKDASCRQLPGLHELLSPSLRHDTSSPGKYPSLAGTVGRPAPGNFHSPTTFGPPPQPWHTMHQSLPGPQSFNADRPVPRTDSVFRSSNAPQYNTGNLGPPSAYPTPTAQRQSISTGSEFRTPIPVHHHECPEEARRDSARSNSTFSTNNVECIGQQHFPGRGLCYVYSNGDTCPVVIDGEMVNPMWGTTKAGKARKRLAQACLNCREKKIRCEPRQPRCVQCEKSKRECIMYVSDKTLPPRESMSHEMSRPTSQQQSPDMPVPVANSIILPTLSPAPNRQSPPEMVLNPLESRQFYPIKRRRSDEDEASTSPQDMSKSFSVRPKLSLANLDHPPINSEQLQREASRVKAEADASSDIFPASGISGSGTWDVDPFETNPDDTVRLLNAFFVQSIACCNNLFPKRPFWKWVTGNRHKSTDERMVLLAMLAIGGATAKDKSSFAVSCAERASLAAASRLGKFGLPLAQARLLLCIYRYAKGHDSLASEYQSGAINVLKMCGMNTEAGCAVSDSDPVLFDLKREQLVESKRRTFWSVLLLDRQTCVYFNTFSVLRNESVHLKLPTSESDFENGFPSRAPFFETSITRPAYMTSPGSDTVSPGAQMFNACRVSGYVDEFIMTHNHRFTSSYARDYEVFFRNADEQLSRWFAGLPADLHISGFSLGKAVQHELTGVITVMSSLYHVTVMRSCRYTWHKQLGRNQVAKNIQKANHSAHQLLQLAHTLCAFGQNLPEGQCLQDLVSPFFATAVTMAIDTISAGGYLSDLRKLVGAVMDGFTIIQTIGYTWPVAKVQLCDVERRMSDLQTLFHNPEQAPPNVVLVGGFGWRCKESFIKAYDIDYDLIYGVENEEYLHALRG
ncbi:hypothetical protein CAC42_3426 [Sphaceloma murrayae]|uniref:Zn(2)-C6 fungal-type domain-containing protein n=1 Tax=Sphaceloma murrayae TaxID=2082308 RepID=A0A2K1R1B5_9PEZI|nr:hypothetical protein CAC42_3426 [Sphaceloma murrayae]